MAERYKPLLDRQFLKSELHYEYESYKGTPDERVLVERLTGWSNRRVTGEREIEAAFIARFFEETWGYRSDGSGADSWTLQQQFPVADAGAGGAGGSADLALGRFGQGGTDVPQVLCEFKGVGANLDKPQPRKGSTRSPVGQALDYLRFARRGLFDSAPVLPRFALVTNMNEFRLYWYDLAPQQYLQFRISSAGQLDLLDSSAGSSLLGDSDEDRFDRFLFWRLFRPDMLLSDFGRTRLEQVVERQGSKQRKLERGFYDEYRAYRLRLYDHIKLQPLDGVSDREKLRVAQKLLDRFVFVMFAEDMGQRVAFPPNLLRDLLVGESKDRFYDPEDTNIWQRMRRLFRTMNAGGEIGERIHSFNGGLFAPDPLIDRLELPNMLFCARGQGRNQATVEADKRTLLFFSYSYNFAAEGNADNAIGLYTLGHIFEQSIVELEVLEADAENRLSLTEITKRKRDGVYYTPEPIVRRIIDETIAPLLARWRTEAGWPETGDPTREATDAYWRRLTAIRVVDPACGSGAFLITAYRYLLEQFRETQDVRYALGHDVRRLEDGALSRMILADNLFGVDINPLSAEIAQLSLWLHSARPRETLATFTDTIKVGNSLVGPRLFERYPEDDFTLAARERIAVFDWDTAFPQVCSEGGFDVVIGNPPYVKLQHFRRVYEETALYLRDGVGGETDYASTQTGNFDLYLPFIEKGLRLLRPGGRLGYIAPNLWPTLEYGAALRTLVRERRALERWIDFRSHQVFEEATIYTAIQVFTADANDTIRIEFAADGDLGKVNWAAPAAVIRYDELPEDGAPWLFAPGPVRALIGRLAETCRPLGHRSVTSAIFQGLITSADDVYHLKRLGDGRYLHESKDAQKQPLRFEVALEDAIMKPLVSGPEAKRFIDPATDTYLLFPYLVDAEGARLWTSEEMAEQYPRAWEYLRRFERELRRREAKAFDDQAWYRFGRNQNIDKQETSKLFVSQLVAGMRVSFDEQGDYYANNVRVNCIIPRRNGWYLLGALNSPITNYIFKWLGKPKVNNYYEANKQFIAPLPIPAANDDDTAEVARIARALQAGYTERARLRTALKERIDRVAVRPRPAEWLLPGVQVKAAIEADAPRLIPDRDRRGWADRRQKEQIEAALAQIDDAISLDSRIEAAFEDGELMLRVDGTPVCRGIYLEDQTGAFLAAQWQVAALGFEPTGKGNAKRLTDALRKVGDEAPPALRDQIIDRQARLLALAGELRALEAELHTITVRLYGLTPEERRLVERGR